MRRRKDTCYVPITHAYASAGKNSIGSSRLLVVRIPDVERVSLWRELKRYPGSTWCKRSQRRPTLT